MRNEEKRAILEGVYPKLKRT